MRKNKLLLLLVLLMTAATGAWGMQIYISYPSWPTGTNVNGDGNLVLEMEASDSFENMKAKIEDKSGLNPTYMKLYFNSVEMANDETLNAKGVTSNSVLTLVYTLYTVSLKDGVKDADKWTISPNPAPEGSPVTIQYTGRLKVKGVTATSDAAPAGKTVDLSTLTADYEAKDGDVLTGTLANNVKISIAAGATVTLDGVNISNGQIACSGNANIILMGANTVTAASEKAAIKIGGPGTTLTITGSGSLTAQGGLEAAGIGTDRNENGELSFGNIVINGGTVTATGGGEGAGIGTGLADGEFNNTSITCGDITINGGTVTAIGGLYGAGIGTGPTMSDGGSASITCGDITINGGTVTATGGGYGPGIGTGVSLKYGYETASNRCGNITIGAGVISVTATKGSSYSPNSIGKGYNYNGTQNYGTITIGGTVYATGVTTSPFTYDPAAPASTTLNNTIKAWTAGSYAVPAGGLTYSDAITVSGDVTLTLTDGQTLTLNKGISLASGATLTVEGNGTMNINGTNNSTASTVAGTGMLVLTSGTLNAKGGDGESIYFAFDYHGGSGGTAINGSVTVSGGTLTAIGGNGGEAYSGSEFENSYGGSGGTAITGSVTINSGTLTATGGNGGKLDCAEDCTHYKAGNGGDAIGGSVTENGGTTTFANGSDGSASFGSGCSDCNAGSGGKGHN